MNCASAPECPKGAAGLDPGGFAVKADIGERPVIEPRENLPLAVKGEHQAKGLQGVAAGGGHGPGE
eukprot:CAMPEP_0184458904 /NCGR_PEP_ID=MMETSP0740-20130409/34937_1 /TAXON_ID=385413 /ORGANISM="Thalassiosira miniscula, Strain CCMP1093" /LENGTH=65 /DNA_ID=CAMNT_0026831749 /DNA_START=210 /DNA_END=408 /DNA_ORIENTATION=-